MEKFERTDGSFDSTNGSNIVKYYIMKPAVPIKAVLQFCHGMAEHSQRYLAFGEFLCENGIAFCIADHIGHGKSVSSTDELGYFAKKNGWIYLVKDQAKFTGIIKAQFADVPHIIAGHSMGSFVTRAYISMQKKQTSAAIIIGTGLSSAKLSMGAPLSRLVQRIKGEQHKSKFIDNVSFGSYNKKIKSNKTKFDWLSRDENEVAKYIDDPLCGFLFSASAFADVSSILSFVSTKKWANSIDKSLPLYLLSGDKDPVSHYGKDVPVIAKRLGKSGVTDVQYKLYPDARHELLNETNKQEVYDDILNWINKTVLGAVDI